MSAAAPIETRDLLMRFPQQQGWKSILKREPGKVALADISLTVESGEIFGLLGPNGAGKTTLVKILSTLTIPSAGQAFVAGLDVVRDSLAVRRRLGVVYGDERSFYWRLSALDNLLFYASLYGIPSREARSRSMELLEMVGLSHAAHLRMHHYSSGMKQRASIARGLLNDPDILIMDEPTRTLDPMAAGELRRLMKERVVRAGRTVLLATNIMAEAEALCDRIAFINSGRIEMIGEIDAIRSVLQADEVHHLVVSGLPHGFIDRLRTLPGIDSLTATAVGGGQQRLELSTGRDGAIIPDIVRRVVEAGGDVWSCSREKLTLDEMFRIIVEKSRKAEERERVAV